MGGTEIMTGVNESVRYGWDSLIENPKKIDGKRVCLEGRLVGGISGFLTDRQGIEITLSPHIIESNLSPLVDNMDAKVLVFLPGMFTNSQFQAYDIMRRNDSCLYVEGIFRYEPNEHYIGKVEAEEWNG